MVAGDHEVGSGQGGGFRGGGELQREVGQGEEEVWVGGCDA